MNKDLHYSGYSTSPSDYECPDGSLAASFNLINDDGHISPIPAPSPLMSLNPGHRLFLHKVGERTNYIAYHPDGSAILWWGANPPLAGSDIRFRTPMHIDSLPDALEPIVSIAAVGYIIIVSTADATHYIRYNANDHAYIYLGSKIPDIDIDFALKLTFTLEQTRYPDLQVASSTDIVTGDTDWQSLVSVDFDFGQIPNESMSEDFGEGDYKYGTDHISIPDISLVKGVEYKFLWRGPSYSELLIVYGHKGDMSSSTEIITNCYKSSYNAEVPFSLTVSDDWVGLTFRLFKKYGTVKCSGTLIIQQGMDKSDVDSDLLSAYIKYTSDSHTTLMGFVNKFVNEQTSEHSRFIYPFLIRYAVRLYDGSYLNLSQPVLMMPNTGYAPSIGYASISSNNDYGIRLTAAAFAADIRYKAENTIPDNWRDIIAGIDIFISLPVWAYNQSQEYDGTNSYFTYCDTATGQGYGSVYINGAPGDAPDSYTLCNIDDYISRLANDYLARGYVQVAPRSASDILDDITNTSNFYKIASLNFDQVNDSAAQFTDLPLEKGVLSSLAARPTISDDMLHYQGFRGAYLKEFNRRLHLCGSSPILPVTPAPHQCINYFDSTSDSYASVDTYISVSTDSGTKVIHRHSTRSGADVGSPWFFYPDSRAFKAELFFSKDGQYVGKAELPLQAHPMLNGAYWIADSLSGSMPITFSDSTVNPYEGQTLDDSAPALSTIYVSETNNPFSFKAVSAVSVGASQLFAISTAARALSQGQFGQFPLYAFTDEGVWALETNSVGSYSAVQPITRDVCTNIDAITQIDSAVLFPTSRGIMMLAGSQAQCITDSIDSLYPFDPLQLPHLQEAISRMGASLPCPAALPSWSSGLIPFLTGAGMLYDYPRQRIIIFNPAEAYAYVYSLRSQSWAMISSNIIATVNSYPEALAIDADNMVIDLSTLGSQSSTLSPQLLVTRPLKLDAPDILKTVNSIIQRGHFQKGHVQSVLYGSRDLYNWHLVWSQKDHYLRGFSGTPYKYFRIALLCDLSPDESIFGASIQFNPKLTNQPR